VASRLPILADALYGDGEPLVLSKLKRRWKGDAFEERPVIARSALHAYKVAFLHPANGVRLEIEAPLPRDFKAALNQLRKLRAL
jgi:23S rRNA pseudouridine955/2504/2580 synthase/23S rRNA pseudouridine1911/1915/1917 synthase